MGFCAVLQIKKIYILMNWSEATLILFLIPAPCIYIFLNVLLIYYGLRIFAYAGCRPIFIVSDVHAIVDYTKNEFEIKLKWAWYLKYGLNQQNFAFFHKTHRKFYWTNANLNEINIPKILGIFCWHFILSLHSIT